MLAKCWHVFYRWRVFLPLMRFFTADQLLFLLQPAVRTNDRRHTFVFTANDMFYRESAVNFSAAVIFNEPQVFWSAVTNLRDSYSAR